MIDTAQRHLVLVGGGHSHALVLDSLATHGHADLRLTLISPARYSLYSGMVPGVIAGQYHLREAQFDIATLAERVGASFVQGSALRVDAESRLLELSDRSRLPYDLVSFDIGTQPKLETPVDDGAPLISARPVGPAIAQLEAVLGGPSDGRRIVVIGAGAAGTEIACTIATRVRSASGATITVCDQVGRPLAAHGARAAALVERTFAERGIRFVGGTAVERVTRRGVRLVDQREVPADLVVWAAGGGAPPIFADSGLPVDARGYLLIGADLRSPRHAEIFAAGDCATLTTHPALPKAGVYAVRQAPVLAHNLRAAARGEGLQHYRPQRRALALLNMGDGRAILTYGRWAWRSRWAWWLKDRIDRRFVAQFAR
jgi:selenide, water dikinase